MSTGAVAWGTSPSRTPSALSSARPPRAFKSFGRIRRARNDFEDQNSDTCGPTVDDTEDAISTAIQARDAAVTVLDQHLLTPWSS
jgi:hypothetical protein